jgi:hypothetical protein
MLTHEHRPEECRRAFAAWAGFPSPLRRRPTVGSCIAGGHRLWWTVEAESAAAALAQLPPFLAERTEVTEVRQTPIP